MDADKAAHFAVGGRVKQKTRKCEPLLFATR